MKRTRSFAQLIGCACQRARTRAGWSQEDVADRIRISLERYQLIECGRVTPPLRIALRLVRVLGISLDALAAATAEGSNPHLVPP